MTAAGVQAAWAARRALMEGATVTAERLAAACGLKARSLTDRAAREGWAVAATAALSRAQRIGRVHDRLLDKVEREQMRNEARDAPLDKAGMSELAATARILAKIGEITRDEDDARQKQLEQDADIATILDRLDRQILDLARHLAKEMAGGNADEPPAGAGES